MAKSFSKTMKSNLWPLLLLLPTLIPLGVLWMYPLVKTFFISFTDWNYISPTFDFVKFDNYKGLVTDSFFYKVLMNTFVFTFFTVIPPIIIGIAAAVMLNKVKAVRNFFVATIFSSWITPTVVVSMVWVSIFDEETGIVNSVLSRVGIEPVGWLVGESTAMIVVIIVTIWKYAGMAALLLTSSMAQLDPDVEKANSLDGGKGLRKLFRITLPAISPILIFLFVLFTLDSLKAYDQIYILTQGGPSGATSTILYYFFVVAFEWYETGVASALAIIFLGICLLISVMNYMLTRVTFKN